MSRPAATGGALPFGGEHRSAGHDRQDNDNVLYRLRLFSSAKPGEVRAGPTGCDSARIKAGELKGRHIWHSLVRTEGNGPRVERGWVGKRADGRRSGSAIGGRDALTGAWLCCRGLTSARVLQTSTIARTVSRNAVLCDYRLEACIRCQWKSAVRLPHSGRDARARRASCTAPRQSGRTSRCRVRTSEPSIEDNRAFQRRAAVPDVSEYRHPMPGPSSQPLVFGRVGQALNKLLQSIGLESGIQVAFEPFDTFATGEPGGDRSAAKPPHREKSSFEMPRVHGCRQARSSSHSIPQASSCRRPLASFRLKVRQEDNRGILFRLFLQPHPRSKAHDGDGVRVLLRNRAGMSRQRYCGGVSGRLEPDCPNAWGSCMAAVMRFVCGTGNFPYDCGPWSRVFAI